MRAWNSSDGRQGGPSDASGDGVSISGDGGGSSDLIRSTLWREIHTIARSLNSYSSFHSFHTLPLRAYAWISRHKVDRIKIARTAAVPEKETPPPQAPLGPPWRPSQHFQGWMRFDLVKKIWVTYNFSCTIQEFLLRWPCMRLQCCVFSSKCDILLLAEPSNNMHVFNQTHTFCTNWWLS